MEDVMLGTKRTLPLWQAKRQKVPLERALTSPARASSATRAARAASALAAARARKRMAEESKKKGRFAER
jgi:hypothetical protein